MSPTLAARREAFCTRFGLRVPILLAPMAGASAAALSIAVAKAGGLGAMRRAADEAGRDQGLGDRAARRHQRRLPAESVDARPAAAAPIRRASGSARLPRQVGAAGAGRGGRRGAGPISPPNAEGLLAAGPPIVSSVRGLYPPDVVAPAEGARYRLVRQRSDRRRGRARPRHAGADVVVAQGMEAGGHRGCFDDQAPSGRDGRAVRAAPGGGRRGARAGGGDRRHRRCARRRRGAGPRRQRPRRSAPASCAAPEAKVGPRPGPMRWRAPPRKARFYRPRLQRSRRPQHRDRLRAPQPRRMRRAPAPYPVQRGLTAAMREAAGKAGDGRAHAGLGRPERRDGARHPGRAS